MLILTGPNMKLFGDPYALRRLFQNEDAICRGEQPPHKILLVSSGGGMSCIRVPAYLAAWKQEGITSAIDHAITVSGSGGGFGAWLSGHPHRAVQMFETLAVSGFISQRNRLAPLMRLSMLGDVLRGKFSPIAFDQRRIASSRASWHVVATNLRGQTALIDAKSTAPDAAQAVLASSAFPGLTNPISIESDGKAEQWVDGACGMPLPIAAGIKRFRPDTVIVLESLPTFRLQPILERLLRPFVISLMTRRLPSPIRAGIASMDRLIDHESSRLARRKIIRWCRIAPTGESVWLHPLSTDTSLLRQAANEARGFMARQLELARPSRQI